MTEQAKPRAAGRRGPKPPSGFAVPAAGLAVFAGTFSVLSVQMSAGHDPALGAARTVATAPPTAPKRILVRRIIKKTVILPPLEPRVPAATGGGVVGASAPASGGGAAPVYGGGAAPASAPAASSAPVASRPAPAPAPAAPAPAPAPAPTTRTS